MVVVSYWLSFQELILPNSKEVHSNRAWAYYLHKLVSCIAVIVALNVLHPYLKNDTFAAEEIGRAGTYQSTNLAPALVI